MNYNHEWRRFMSHYFPLFIVVFFAGVFSLGYAVLTLVIGYFSSIPGDQKAIPIYIGVAAASIMLTVLKILVLNGYAIAAQLLQAIFLCTLVVLIPAPWFGGPETLTVVGATAAIIGLAAVRSRRYMEMIAYLTVIRGRVPEALARKISLDLGKSGHKQR